mmetsp:Transcript_35877/g.57152  ORF Transcript_35877/g.57152 Transcript_35877/m.57152 type:complete len:169 (+) Transcript_35877:94-600(+)
MALRRSLRVCADKVPDVFVNFGMEQQFRFVSHPGVMSVAKLLEMRMVTQMRANFTEENIAAMKKFDPELARKAQIAYDHKLPVNFQQLELIDDILPRLLEEKDQLEAARTKVAELPPGQYELPKELDLSAVRPQPGQEDFVGTRAELSSVKYPELEHTWKRDIKELPK